MTGEPGFANAIVVVGAQRSGTTLLRTILNEHPDLLVHPAEPQFLPELYQRFGDPVRNVRSALAYLASHKYLPSSVQPDDLRQHCGQARQTPLPALIHCYLRVWGGDELGGRRVVLKYPLLIFYLDLVQHWFPNVRIVHIVRDPRANVTSQRARWPQFTVWECAQHWRQAVHAARRWRQRYPHQYIELRYEDVIAAPERTLRQLCQELDLPFSERLLTFEQEETVYQAGGIPEKQRFTAPDPARLDSWRKRLSPTDIGLIERACQTEMAWWDYPLLAPTPLPNLTTRLLRERLHFAYKTGGRRLKAWARQAVWRWQNR